MQEESEYVKVSEIAKHFRVSSAAVYRWVDQQRILSRRLGSTIRIHRDEFNYIKQHGLREPAEDSEKNLKPTWA